MLLQIKPFMIFNKTVTHTKYFLYIVKLYEEVLASGIIFIFIFIFIIIIIIIIFNKDISSIPPTIIINIYIGYSFKQKIITLRSRVAEMFVRIVRIKALLTQPTEESTAHSANHFVATI